MAFVIKNIFFNEYHAAKDLYKFINRFLMHCCYKLLQKTQWSPTAIQ